MSKLLDQTRDLLRVRHYSYRTEQAYLDWIVKYICFHGIRHPAEMGAEQIEGFLTHLAFERSVAASTQNQALAALLFLYPEVLQINLPWLDKFKPAKKSEPAHAAAFVCDASASERLRYSDDSGNARTQGTNDDHDLHARSQSISFRRQKSG